MSLIKKIFSKNKSHILFILLHISISSHEFLILIFWQQNSLQIEIIITTKQHLIIILDFLLRAAVKNIPCCNMENLPTSTSQLARY